ncbi:MAG: DUF1015 family protein [Myxococcota bacterium]
MVEAIGLRGLRPAPEHVTRVSAPPYDVIKPGSKLEARLQKEPASLYHITLGDRPKEALDRLRGEGFLVEDDEPAYYVYEQRFGDEARTGVLLAAEVSPYEERKIIRHEKTFDHKVKGRIALREAIGLSVGPVFHLTRAPIAALLEEAKQGTPLYEFDTDLGGISDLHGIHNRVFRVPEASDLGRRLKEALAPHPFYIADGHHRYHASLLHGQTHHLCYVTSEARIQAYNRVVNGVKPFAELKGQLDLEPAGGFATPPKHAFCLYDGEGSYLLRAKTVPQDVVGRLDCSILERELYPALGLTHDMIIDPAHFDYYPESALEDMKEVVDRGDYDLAIALHPVSLDELIAVADAGLENPDIVMPEKSTFFAPKILSGLFLYRHERRPA